MRPHQRWPRTHQRLCRSSKVKSRRSSREPSWQDDATHGRRSRARGTRAESGRSVQSVQHMRALIGTQVLRKATTERSGGCARALFRHATARPLVEAGRRATARCNLRYIHAGICVFLFPTRFFFHGFLVTSKTAGCTTGQRAAGPFHWPTRRQICTLAHGQGARDRKRERETKTRRGRKIAASGSSKQRQHVTRPLGWVPGLGLWARPLGWVPGLSMWSGRPCGSRRTARSPPPTSFATGGLRRRTARK